jgi:hypothetical protein
MYEAGIDISVFSGKRNGSFFQILPSNDDRENMQSLYIVANIYNKDGTISFHVGEAIARKGTPQIEESWLKPTCWGGFL